MYDAHVIAAAEATQEELLSMGTSVDLVTAAEMFRMAASIWSSDIVVDF